MARTINFDFRIGGGGPLEVPYGFVTLWATKVFDRSPSRVLTMETKVAIQNGLATISDVETNGAGPVYTMAYWVQVEDYNCNAQRFLVAVPDGTAPINFLDLKFLDYITGDVLLDIEEWIALYGDLPNRVTAVESKNTAQDTKISALDGQGQRGYKFEQTVGRVVKLWDYQNNRDQIIFGDTGTRSILVPAVAPLKGTGTITIGRYGNEVTLVLDSVEYLGTSNVEYLTASGFIPTGFRPGYTENPTGILTNNNANATYPVAVIQASRLRRMGPALAGGEPGQGVNALRGTIKWRTTEPWPTTLPGVAA